MPHDNPFEPMIKNIGNYVSGALYAQGVIPPIGINNYEGMALASPADVHLLAAKDPVIDEIAVGMSGNLIGENTVTGTPPLQLPNSAGYPLQWFEVALSPYQEGTGDPAPDNVRPIHGTDKVTVWTSGKNLIDIPDKTMASEGYIFNDSFDFLPGQYVLSYYSTTPANLGAIVAVGKDDVNCSVSLARDNSRIVATINAPKGIKSIRVYNGPATYTNIQLEFGSTATGYTPYIAPSSTVITLPQAVYTGTIGSEGGESRWGEVDLGDLAWEYIGSSNKYFQTNSIKNIIKPPVTGSTVADAMCEAYKMVSWNVTQYATGLMAIAGANNPEPGRLSCINTNYTDVASFATAMRGIKLVFELKTANTFAVPSATIPTPKGSATTWATAEDGTVDSMSAVYIQNE